MEVTTGGNTETVAGESEGDQHISGNDTKATVATDQQWTKPVQRTRSTRTVSSA